ncbi:MAG: class I SAM-dependent methyltransferase [Candidatus Riflebacteria bacterium]|nr:class I SAM-dependent methyltransferase [Candidatus Riflebacteria bacterium]
MAFYSNIAAMYNRIFPLDEDLAPFIHGYLPAAGGKVLDIGCATGVLANALGRMGHSVTGIDLDAAMVRLARKYQNTRVSFQAGNMLQLKNLFSPAEFEAVVCLGNTMAHLPDPASVRAMASQVFSILQPDGIFFGQIIHYDRILRDRLPGLPVIEQNGIRFERRYIYPEQESRLIFETVLTEFASGESQTNRVFLYPLTMQELKTGLESSGFQNITLFADTDKSALKPDSHALYFTGQKP